MTSPLLWLETIRVMWNEFKSHSGEEFEKCGKDEFERCCGKLIQYLYTVKAADSRQELLMEDMRDILFDSENPKQVSCYIGTQEEKERMRYYVAITRKTLSSNVKLKRSIYEKGVNTSELTYETLRMW